MSVLWGYYSYCIAINLIYYDAFGDGVVFYYETVFNELYDEIKKLPEQSEATLLENQKYVQLCRNVKRLTDEFDEIDKSFLGKYYSIIKIARPFIFSTLIYYTMSKMDPAIRIVLVSSWIVFIYQFYHLTYTYSKVNGIFPEMHRKLLSKQPVSF